jgi:hypothetical protein
MIGLSDIGLAYLAIAAGRVAPSRRGRWLKSVACELEGSYTPSPTARRLRKYQARRRSGQKCYRLTLDEIDTEEMLLASGTLAPADRDDHSKVEAALQRLLSILIADHHGNAFPPGRGIYDTVRVGLCLSALRRRVSDGSPKRRRPSR